MATTDGGLYYNSSYSSTNIDMGTGSGTQWLWNPGSYTSIDDSEAVKRMREAEAEVRQLTQEKSAVVKRVYELQQQLEAAMKANEIIGERKGFAVPVTVDAAEAILDKFAAFRCLGDKACYVDDGDSIHSIRCIEHNDRGATC